MSTYGDILRKPEADLTRLCSSRDDVWGTYDVVLDGLLIYEGRSSMPRPLRIQERVKFDAGLDPSHDLYDRLRNPHLTFDTSHSERLGLTTPTTRCGLRQALKYPVRRVETMKRIRLIALHRISLITFWTA